MPTKIAPNGFAETRDHISWVMGYAPDFKKLVTLDEAFGDLEHGFETVRRTLKDPERLGILDFCLTQIHEAKEALRQGDVIRGKQKLLDASYTFRTLRRPKRNPASVEDPGESADDTVDD